MQRGLDCVPMARCIYPNGRQVSREASAHIIQPRSHGLIPACVERLSMAKFYGATESGGLEKHLTLHQGNSPLTEQTDDYYWFMDLPESELPPIAPADERTKDLP